MKGDARYMKKAYSLFLISLITFSPIIASASEMNQSITTEPVVNEESVPVTEQTPPAVATPETTPTIPSTDAPMTDTQQTIPNVNTPQPDAPVDESNSTNIISDSVLEDTEKLIDKTELEESESDETTSKSNSVKQDDMLPVHEHSFVYTSNEDGTHTVTCSAMVELNDSSETCYYESIEECTYSEDNICIYCGYTKPEEKKEFAPSISFSISNQSCTIDESNPVISVSLNQEDFDITYAQVCFANYGKNKYINVGLAQGKYYDTKNGEYVYTSNNNWYANPNIDGDYVAGEYSLRSIYVRSSSGESIHYSIESDSLPVEYQNITINVNEGSSSEVQNPTEPIIEKPTIQEPVTNSPEPQYPDPEPSSPGDDSSNESSTPVAEKPVIEENPMPQPDNDKTIEEGNTPSTGEGNKSEENKNPENTQDSKSEENKNNSNKNEENNNQNNNSFTNFLDFLKRLFGWG